jgi:fibro-slime domain-containing protein
VIHTYENSDANNLKDFTGVTMNIVDKKEFDEKIIGDNTLELYYNETKDSNKLYKKTVTFTQDDFGMALDTSNIEEIDIPEPPPPPPITEIPHQIAGGADGWCVGDGKAVHQDVPGCGRICSTWEYTGSKNKGSWGLWGGNQNGIDCPAAKLDQVWKLTGGSTSGRPNRELAVGKVSEPQSTFTYELIMNKKNTSLGIHVEYIKLDGVLATKAQTTIHKNPNRNNKPDNMFSIGSGTENYASWNANGHNVGDKIFTIVSDKKVDKMDIVYTRPQYAPGWIIKENGVTKITETSNRGYIANPRPVVYTYDIKNGKSSPFTIPHQIPRATDGWCGHANSVHQDVPGCGRLCSDVNAVGSKNKNTWGSWDKYPGSVECPAAKLDEVYQFLNGKRSLRVGKYSESGAMDLTGGFKWYYYKGSYFSGVNSFSGKTPTNQGENVTDFSSKHKATGGHLRNDGNEDNYAVKWEGFFVPKKTGSHKFWTESDDMSYLYVNDILVVDNGGLHGMVKKSGSINLTADEKYPIKIYFSEKGGGDELKVWFQGPGMSSAIHNFSGYMLK